MNSAADESLYYVALKQHAIPCSKSEKYVNYGVRVLYKECAPDGPVPLAIFLVVNRRGCRVVLSLALCVGRARAPPPRRARPVGRRATARRSPLTQSGTVLG